MHARLVTILALLLSATAVTGCAVAAGGIAAVAVDEAMEQENGGDGLF